MRTQWAGRGLAIALVAIALVAGVPAVVDADQRPPGPPVPTGVIACSPFVDLPVADLGEVADLVEVGDMVHVVADQSTGPIVHQEVRLDLGEQWEGTAAWDGPPEPWKWVDFGFSEVGIYIVTLTVTDACGRTDSTRQGVWVFDL